MANFSAVISIFPGDSLVGKGHARVGIDIQAPVCTPRGEYSRIEINLLNDMPLSGDLLSRLIRVFEPLGKCS